MSHHVDDGRGIYNFAHDVWVHCPKCAGLGHVRWHSKKPAHFGCLGCGYVEETRDNQPDWKIREAIDPFFGHPLWLAADFRGESLWFYNPEHLEYVRDYIAANLRTRQPELRGQANSTLTSRLPLWMKSAKNRDALLKAIEKLEAKGIQS